VRDLNRETLFGVVADFADDVKWTANLMTRSRVAMYPIDARGLFTNPDMSAAVAAPRGADRTPPMRGSTEEHFLDLRATEKFGMQMLAEETGGKPFYDTNGLKEAVQEGHQRRLQLLHARLCPHQSPMGWSLPQRAREVGSIRRESLLRETRSRSHAGHVSGYAYSSLSLERTTRTLPYMQH
jgi:hypothetical protein